MIEKFIITNFRNHDQSKLDICGYNNIVLEGNNGAGKTAILEAISLLSSDKSFRGASLHDLIKYGTDNFSIFCLLRDETRISIFKNSNDSNKKIKINGIFSNFNDLSQKIKLISLTPKEDRLFVDSVNDRRLFFDKLVACFDKEHLNRIQSFNKLLTQRTFVLKNKRDYHWLDSIDLQLSQLTPAIATSRIRYISEINYFLENIFTIISGKIEDFLLKSNIVELETKYLNYLYKNRFLESDKMIIDGIHKSDFNIKNKNNGFLASLMSTGQQKKILLDLIIAHIKLMNIKFNEKPVILLDEILSHLDFSTREEFINNISSLEGQFWFSCVKADVIPNKSLIITCDNGIIKSIIKK